MFLFVVVVSLVTAQLRGGRIDRLLSFSFRHVWLVFLAFAIQVALHSRALAALDLFRQAAPYMYSSAYYVLLLCFFLNRQAPGVLWLASGSLANLLVITLNGGKMPVAGDALAALGFPAYRDAIAAGATLTNTLLGPATRLPWLADVIVGSPPFPKPTLFSVGDALLSIGVFILVQKTMVVRPAAAEVAEGRGGSVPPTDT